MKDKRIWIVIGCILVIGTGVTHYTKYYVKSQGAAMMAEITAGPEETAAASSFAPAWGQQDTETGGTDAGMAAGRAEPATLAERRMTGDAGPGNAASGNTASGDAGPGSAGPGSAGPGSAGPGNAAYGAAPAAEAAGAFSSDQAAPAMTDAADETMASDTAGAAGAGEGPAVSETASEKDMPISPLTGARTREYKASLIVDYRKRLEDLDTQILKMREEETDSNVYSIKTSAETELKLWEGELNSIYNALMEMLSQGDAAKLASEQQEWLKNRDARAAESSGRNSGSMEGISYAATLVSLTRDRAYELAGRYEEANGVFCEEEDSSQTALP
ncbi:lysozyme inhibitor LprI family protein [Enterocloster clostridioformis]|uniref:lysozyme inhibitor LprI family protein n=1 Tax=Enterocloster clostridioformis TaxID=1531 RepID=UPI0004169D60|nr:lysozyme inhibitor LprI family protein [Enterocloster clostridioformis]